MAVGATLELWKNGQWEKLCVTHVTSVLSARANMGEVPLYSLESLSNLGKRYLFDFSSFPGADTVHTTQVTFLEP